MKFLQNEKWKLEKTTKWVCLITTIYYGVTIASWGLIYFIGFLVVSFMPDEIIDSFGTFADSYIDVFGDIFILVNFLLYVTKIVYVLPVIITIYLLSVVFSERAKRNNSRVFVHPLVISSIVTSFVGTFVIVYIFENSF